MGGYDNSLLYCIKNKNIFLKGTRSSLEMGVDEAYIIY